MRIRIHHKPSGIPTGKIAANPAIDDNGTRQVNVFMSALDSFDTSTVVASLRLSTAEARDLAARLLDSANKAEVL